MPTFDWSTVARPVDAPFLAIGQAKAGTVLVLTFLEEPRVREHGKHGIFECLVRDEMDGKEWTLSPSSKRLAWALRQHAEAHGGSLKGRTVRISIEANGTEDTDRMFHVTDGAK